MRVHRLGQRPPEAAIQLEQMWDEMAKNRALDILCTYPLTAREKA